MSTATFPQYRLSADVHQVNIYARYAAMGLLRSKLADSLRVLLESGVPAASELDPREIAELLTSLTFTLPDVDEHPELFAQDPTMVYMPSGAVEGAAQVVRRTGEHIQSGLLAVPAKPSAADPRAYGQSYIDVADATQDMIEQIRGGN